MHAPRRQGSDTDDSGGPASDALHDKFRFVQQRHAANVANRFGKPSRRLLTAPYAAEVLAS